MTNRNRRKTAAELSLENDPKHLLKVSRVPFSEAFPNIKELRIEVFIEDWGYSGKTEQQRRRVFTQDHPPGPFVDCVNEACYGGGIDLQHILEYCIGPNRTEYSNSHPCLGHEGSARKNRGPCYAVFDVKVKVTYRD
jgi:hypothetical protein